ncbi:MAG: hypothetical protein ACXVRI_05090 [Gaiellaceae bacterium]
MAFRVRIALLVAAATSAATLGGGFFTAPAVASQLIDRNASRIHLAVNGKGEALITYRAKGRLKHVLVWNAENAIAPTLARAQVAFSLDYAGGWRKYCTDYWKTFTNACRPYVGPKLAWKVTACTASDGSHWALQAWQRALPDLGRAPTAAQAEWELRLSHWTGELPVLSIELNWAYKRFDHLFGTLVYAGHSVYGFHSTSGGAPLDSFGRNIYLDTYDSAYGPGWKRDNSFLTHKSSGAFCYGFYPHGTSPVGKGTSYRATVEGPGVTPDVMWQSLGPGLFDPIRQADANTSIRALGDNQCNPV